MEFHEYANLFPMMPDTELQELASDIKAHGQENPITSYNGKILDGRNRFRACQIANVDPQIIAYGGNDPLGYVISHNLKRRHLTDQQRAMVAKSLANLKAGNPTLGPISGIPLISQTKAAEMLNVSVDSVKQAKKIEKDGVSELSEAVMQGGVSLAAAVEIAKLPEDEQREVVSRGADAIKARAKEARKPAPVPPPDDEYTAPDDDAPRKPARLPKYVHDDAERLWLLARIELDKITKKDASRERVFREVIEYAQAKLSPK